MNRITPAKTPMSSRLALKTPQRKANSANSLNRDPVQVYCRIRPMQSDADLSCLKVISPTTVVLTPPEFAVNYKVGNLKETQCTFSQVFDADSKQRDVYMSVAQSLVENLIRGKSGLLFSYGVTGSGKTYTMTGDVKHRGIMPRCLDALFKTISDYQTKKFVFKPDRMNGFEILSEADAMLERQTELNSNLFKGRRKDSDPEIASQASTDADILPGVDEDNMYAVFVTYVEVYNNSVFDLLEEPSTSNMRQATLQSRVIREDANHNMYVHGVTELEVKSVEQAIEAFQRGQKRKRVGHTILNAESSRSHSVFTIRLVQAPTDAQGEYVVQDKQTVTVSQLSLVDLAGSERLNRTKNTGQRLREAGNINNSLMTLRTCLEVLRENQMTGGSKKVPYRDSKLTNLFKNFFDGEGNVRMIVCVNPRAEEYDETVQVMKFSEMTQEVQIARPTPMKTASDIGFTPGRRKANQIFKKAVDNLEENGKPEARLFDIDLGLVYSLGPSFPNYRLDSVENERVIYDLMKFLENRIEKRRVLLDDFNKRQDAFRLQLMHLEKENLMLKSESSSIKATLKMERQKNGALENRIIIHERSLDDLNRKLKEVTQENDFLRQTMDEKQRALLQKEKECENTKKKYAAKVGMEKNKMESELEQRLQQQRSKFEEKYKQDAKKLKLVSKILNSTEVNVPSSSRSSDSGETMMKASDVVYRTPNAKTIHRGLAVANPRHRRSKSADRWLEHRDKKTVPLGTIFQPYYKARKSVTQVEEQDLKDAANGKYCLIDQVADTDGEVETRIYKGDIIPTTGGGAQVVLNDVELLKQFSPTSPSRQHQQENARKRSIDDTETPSKRITAPNLAEKCAQAIEGHSKKKKLYM
ncbi:kinesin-like protein KIF23 isoform X2 [Culicoides brevitarsis]|uniref:kinesin-like protein KIF23 isoform X2 n=1 Tax=Culicoides brevitarsis TaxID=469753 RepID=UPI00307C68E2